MAKVAPLAGAWIETNCSAGIHKKYYVAPLAGAWIETSFISIPRLVRIESHPLRVRGL